MTGKAPDTSHPVERWAFRENMTETEEPPETVHVIQTRWANPVFFLMRIRRKEDRFRFSNQGKNGGLTSVS